MLFTIVPVIIVVIALLTFGGAIAVFVGFFRHRNAIHQMTDDALHQPRDRSRQAENTSGSRPAGEYNCTHCGAAPDSDTDISPDGAFKCRYCDRWSAISR